MRLIPLAALILSLSEPAFAQDWVRFVSPQDGFSANYPGQPKVDATTYVTEPLRRLLGAHRGGQQRCGRGSDYRLFHWPFHPCETGMSGTASYLLLIS